MAARTVKIRHDEETRAKIKTSQLLNRLQNHAFGKCEMLPTQVRAAEICLRKVLPDLSQLDNNVTVRHERDYTDADLCALIARMGSERAAEAEENTPLTH